MKRKTKIIIILLCIVSLLGGTSLYANDYYRAENVSAYLASGDGVQVSEIAEGRFFDGPGEEDALIFYPGAKVEETAYAPLLRSLAAQGVDCFLVKMPLRLAVLNFNKANRIRKRYPYARYYLAGHSLGGAMAADHAALYKDAYAGLFLLAAYPSMDLSAATLPVVFIYGDNDGVLNRKKLKRGFSLVPKGYQKVVIRGGNHAGFASYGAQDGDGNPDLSATEQQRITADTILKTVQGNTAKTG